MSKHVLVVDHDPVSRNHITALLAGREFTSDQAASAKEAIALLESGDYDLVMLDVMLPGENIAALIDELKERFPEQSTHLVLLTDADSELIENLPDDGWCSLLFKPISYGEFQRILDLCIDGTSAAGY